MTEDNIFSQVKFVVSRRANGIDCLKIEFPQMPSEADLHKLVADIKEVHSKIYKGE